MNYWWGISTDLRRLFERDPILPFSQDGPRIAVSQWVLSMDCNQATVPAHIVRQHSTRSTLLSVFPYLINVQAAPCIAVKLLLGDLDPHQLFCIHRLYHQSAAVATGWKRMEDPKSVPYINVKWQNLGSVWSQSYTAEYKLLIFVSVNIHKDHSALGVQGWLKSSIRFNPWSQH